MSEVAKMVVDAEKVLVGLWWWIIVMFLGR